MSCQKSLLHDDLKDEALARAALKGDQRSHGLHDIDLTGVMVKHGLCEGSIECHGAAEHWEVKAFAEALFETRIRMCFHRQDCRSDFLLKSAALKHLRHDVLLDKK